MKNFALVLIALAMAITSATFAMAEAEANTYNIKRFILCKKIADREPSGITNSFPKGTQKVYVFIEALDIKEESAIRIQWLYEGDEVSLIELRLGKGSRWRTYSSKQIGVRKGKWMVRLLDSGDNMLKELSFKVK